MKNFLISKGLFLTVVLLFFCLLGCSFQNTGDVAHLTQSDERELQLKIIEQISRGISVEEYDVTKLLFTITGPKNTSVTWNAGDETTIDLLLPIGDYVLTLTHTAVNATNETTEYQESVKFSIAIMKITNSLINVVEIFKVFFSIFYNVISPVKIIAPAFYTANYRDF